MPHTPDTVERSSSLVLGLDRSQTASPCLNGCLLCILLIAQQSSIGLGLRRRCPPATLQCSN
jgi:hypothetical protein